MKLEYKNITKFEVVFFILCLVLIFIFSFMRAALCLLLLLLIIFFKDYMTNNSNEISKKKNFLFAFLLIFMVYIGLFLFYRYGLDYNKNQYTLNQTRLYIQLPINMTIFLGYLFKIRLKDFNWSINLKSFLTVLLLFIPFILIKDMRILMENNRNFFYIRNFIQQVYYPGVVEEVIFRGYFLTGLLAYGVRKDKANVIQSIIFGLVHILGSKEISINVILSTSLQMFIGFILGKIYLRTKSLTPGIILHALIDTI